MGIALHRQSEMFRSAYLRTFAIAVAEWGFRKSEADLYVSELLPAIRGMFDLDPVQRPAWLRDFPERCARTPKELEALSRKLLASAENEERGLGSLYVPIDPGVEKFADLSLTAHLVSANFCAGDRPPREPTEVLLVHDTLGFDRPRPTKSLEDCIQIGAVGDSIAVCTSLFPIPFGHWQSHYYSAGIPVPASYVLLSNAELRAMQSRIAVEVDGNEVASTSFWLDHWTPNYQKDGGETRCGNWTVVDRRLLRDAAAILGRDLAWSAELNIWRREKEYGEYQRLTHTAVFLE